MSNFYVILNEVKNLASHQILWRDQHDSDL